MWREGWSRFWGVNRQPVSHTERLVSGVGAVLGIGLVILVSRYTLEGTAVPLLIASMGASAVLLFAVPHGVLSQPWSLLGGHLLSALVGVTCQRYLPDMLIAAPLAVGLAIVVMHYAGCIHPPGGATALLAVIGGPAVTDLGYGYLLSPVLLNVVAILIAALLVNLPFAWRRYPHGLLAKKPEPPLTQQVDGQSRELCPVPFDHEDLQFALRQLDLIMPISEQQLIQLYRFALCHAEEFGSLSLQQIVLGSYYSNGKLGDAWEIRQVIDEAERDSRRSDLLIYKVVAGLRRGETARCHRVTFARWAKYQVVQYHNDWQQLAVDVEHSGGER